MSEIVLAPAVPLAVGSSGRRGVGWWGLLCVIATESALFAYLLFSYYYFAVQLGDAWLPGKPPDMKLALPDTLILLCSSATVWWAERGVRRGGPTGRSRLALALSILLGMVFIAIQLLEWRAKPFSITSGPYGSLYFTITGFHMAHVAAGLVLLLLVLWWSALGYFDQRRHVPVLVAAAYWHFVDAVWLVVFFTFYVTPRLW